MEMPDVYAEVYGILRILGKNYTEKLPDKLLEHINEERNKNHIKEFYIDKPVEDQNISLEALEFISFLNLHYWCSEEEKVRLLKIYNENDSKFQKDYSVVFDKKVITEDKNLSNISTEEKNDDLAQYKHNFIKNIFNRLLNLLKNLK